MSTVLRTASGFLRQNCAASRRTSTLAAHFALPLSHLQHLDDRAAKEQCGQAGKALLNGATLSASAGGALLYGTLSADNVSSSEAAQQDKTALNPKEFLKFKLKEVEPISHNTKLFRFELDPETRLGLSVASCLVTRAPVGEVGEDGKPAFVVKAYTPTTQPHIKGHFDLVIKVYPNGRMTQHINSLSPGDYLEIKGPILKLPYAPNMKRHIGMVAGGTGIAPMFQVLEAILNNPDDYTQVSLVFANTSPSDILLQDKLDSLSAAHPNFKVFYVVDKGDEGWKGGEGYVTSDMLKKALPPPSPDTLILVCGPPGMMTHVSGLKAKDKSQGEVEGLLKELGYEKESVYKF